METGDLVCNLSRYSIKPDTVIHNPFQNEVDRWYDLDSPTVENAPARKLCGWLIHEKFSALRIDSKNRFAGVFFNSDYTYEQCVHSIEANEIAKLFRVVIDDYPSIILYERITGMQGLELIYAGNDQVRADQAKAAVPAERARRRARAQSGP